MDTNTQDIVISQRVVCTRCGNTELTAEIDNLFNRRDNPLYGMPPDYALTGQIRSLRCSCGAVISQKVGYGSNS